MGSSNAIFDLRLFAVSTLLHSYRSDEGPKLFDFSTWDLFSSVH